MIGNLLTRLLLPGTSRAAPPVTCDGKLTGNAAFTGITGDATFQFYVLAPNDGNSVEFHNNVFNGTAVPEPSVALVGLLGGLD